MVLDNRRVISAVDREADRLSGAVGRRHREGVDMRAGDGLRRAVENRIGVAAVGGQHEAAEIGAGADDGLEVALAGVDVADRDRADRGQIAG